MAPPRPWTGQSQTSCSQALWPRPPPHTCVFRDRGFVCFLSCSSQLGSLNPFKGTQLPAFFQRGPDTCELLFEHAWQPHQEHFNFVGRDLSDRKKRHSRARDSSERMIWGSAQTALGFLVGRKGMSLGKGMVILPAAPHPNLLPQFRGCQAGNSLGSEQIHHHSGVTDIFLLLLYLFLLTL